MGGTLNQLVRGTKLRKLRKPRVSVLKGNPQLKGICIRVRITKPKKPNSAQRKVARIRLSYGRRITTYIPGQGHNIQQYAVVLVRGGRVRDLPGIRTKIVRGVYDVVGVDMRKQRRSKFGTKRWEKKEKQL